jgi:DNA modification methylase
MSLIRADARALPLPDGCIDACVTDPPYELAFMGNAWDGTGVAFTPATWGLFA